MTNTLQVDAAFDVYAMLGNPVSQTKTPALFNQHCRDNNLSVVMVPFKLAGKTELENLIQMMKSSQLLSGFVSTIPFKVDLYDLCEEHGPAAAALGKVNTVKISPSGKAIGEMFDGIGFAEALKRKGFQFTGKKPLVLGCGAAGQAISLELLRYGVSSCTIIDPDSSALSRFKTIISENHGNYHLLTTPPKDLSAFDLIINASPLGMREEDALPCSLVTARADCYIGDCVTNFETTDFLKAASLKGCTIVSGTDMANGQLMSILKFFNIA